MKTIPEECKIIEITDIHPDDAFFNDKMMIGMKFKIRFLDLRSYEEEYYGHTIECLNEFTDSDGIHYEPGYLFVMYAFKFKYVDENN